ncbi:hypothetical protein BGZ99_006370 [Dissophora globulifera]|uniref:Probable RNA polymerase II nuclear localization protein SLC7A6OS n=1 Tax=Dissophora globulifera TaxID=979702 RepID=A0A9P6RX03_9FUNG|nr:hypothetical protein BGZ99_006370 [Dissophora globulifera]
MSSIDPQMPLSSTQTLQSSITAGSSPAFTTTAGSDTLTHSSDAAPLASPSATSAAAARGGASSDTFTILRIKRKRNEEPLNTLVVQEQLEKADGKKQKTAKNDSKQEVQDTLTGAAILQRFEDRVSERREVLAHEKQEQARSARYRVVHQNRSGLAGSELRPPEVKSSVEAKAEAALEMFNMYDAIKEDEPKSKKQLAQEADESDIMCNFLPMVREYLSISRPDGLDKTLSDEHLTTHDPVSDQAEDQDSEDEYVYDIYYRDLHAEHRQEPGQRGIGSLLWFSDDENNFLNEDDSSDDDFEDSDSNAEDYYQNDYPEDEVSDGQYGYELSDSDDDEYLY